jgi:hypothetical protein
MSPGSPAAAAVYDSATRRSPALAEIGQLTSTLAVLSSLGVLFLGGWTFKRKSDQFAYRL